MIDRAATLQWTKALVAEAAAQAETRMRRGDAAGASVQRKADGSVVTEIDQAIERFLRDAITTRFPDHQIIGEEYGFDAREGEAAYLWALDPIDGTSNLANGLPQWAVSVGLIENDTVIVGVVSSPLLRETYSGAAGLGAALNDVPLAPLPAGGPTDWEDTYAICSTSARLMDFAGVPSRLRVHGSAALEVCWTASGVVRGCQSIGTKIYDVAAGLCIAREVGARPAWLGGDDWTAREMTRRGPREDDLLLTAAPATLAFLRERLRWRTGD